MNAASAIEQRAAEWLLRRQEPGWSPADQAVLDDWLNASLGHKAAYWRLEHGWQMVDRIGALGLREPAEHMRPFRAGWKFAAMAASVAALLLVGGGTGRAPGRTALFRTAIGAHQTVALVDGSKVELNTATTLRAAMAHGRREVWLDKGEAYFEVAHAAGQKFVVHAGQRAVTVLGTKFFVRRDGDHIRIGVVEGKVKVEDALLGGEAPSAIVTAGTVVVAQGPSLLVAARGAEQIQNDLGWRGGMLTFDQTTIAAAVAEFNRYNRTQLAVADGNAASIRIGGTFKTGNVTAFARLLRDAYGLKIETKAEKIVIGS